MNISFLDLIVYEEVKVEKESLDSLGILVFSFPIDLYIPYGKRACKV